MMEFAAKILYNKMYEKKQEKYVYEKSKGYCEKTLL